MSDVRVQIRNVDDDADRYLVDMPTVPCSGDHITVSNDQVYIVAAVTYHVVPAKRIGSTPKVTVWVGKR